MKYTLPRSLYFIKMFLLFKDCRFSISDFPFFVKVISGIPVLRFPIFWILEALIKLKKFKNLCFKWVVEVNYLIGQYIYILNKRLFVISFYTDVFYYLNISHFLFSISNFSGIENQKFHFLLRLFGVSPISNILDIANRILKILLK